MIQRFSRFGNAPLCNLRPERAFRFGSFTLPLCARCTGLIIGTTVFLACLYTNNIITISASFAISLTVPMIIDWFIQRIGLLLSTNTRRFITGLLFGFGISYFVIYITNNVLVINII